MVLEDGEKRELLRIARISIESALANMTAGEHPGAGGKLLEHRGVFVTLRHQGELRGCIGYVEPKIPLYQAVEEVARKTAFEDPRFPPLNAEELPGVGIEISVLSSLQEIRSIDEIEVGRHGLVIEEGPARGLLLPHVAKEYEWDREEFLAHTALKAGLPPDSWRQKGVKVYTFTTNTFSESELYEFH